MLILSVLSISAYGAGWNPDIWDHSKTWIDGPYYTNAYAVKITDVFTFDCTTNYIPAYTTNGFRFQQIDTNYMVYSNSYYTNTLFNSTNASFGTNGFGSTNLYSSNTVTFVYGGITNKCSVSRSVEKIEGIYETGLDIHDVRLCELGLAIYERGSTTKVKLDHDSIYANTVRIKSAVKSMIASFCDTNIAEYSAITNWSGIYVISSIVTNGGVVSTNYHAPLLWTVSNILKSCNLPTNYFEYTPSKNADNDPHGFSVVTTCVSIIRYPSDTNYDANATRTNVVYLYDGTTTNVTGTNGQVVCIARAYTNSIRSTYDGNDYTYWHLTNILAKLIIRKMESENESESSMSCADYLWGTIKTGECYRGYMDVNVSPFCTNGPYDCATNHSDYSGLLQEFDYGYIYTNGFPRYLNKGFARTQSASRRNTLTNFYFCPQYIYGSESLTDYDYIHKSINAFTNTISNKTLYASGRLSVDGEYSISVKQLYRYDSAETKYTQTNYYISGYSNSVNLDLGYYYMVHCGVDVEIGFWRPSTIIYYSQKEITYNVNTNSQYWIQSDKYIEASSWSDNILYVTSSNAYFIADFIEPYTDSELLSLHETDWVEDFDVSDEQCNEYGCITEQWAYYKEVSTKYADTTLSGILYLINYATTNGFKYY